MNPSTPLTNLIGPDNGKFSDVHKCLAIGLMNEQVFMGKWPVWADDSKFERGPTKYPCSVLSVERPSCIPIQIL